MAEKKQLTEIMANLPTATASELDAGQLLLKSNVTMKTLDGSVVAKSEDVTSLSASKADKTYVDGKFVTVYYNCGSGRADSTLDDVESAIGEVGKIVRLKTYISNKLVYLYVANYEEDFSATFSGVVEGKYYEIKVTASGWTLSSKNVADKNYVDTGLATKADKATTYTKTEVDTSLETKLEDAPSDGNEYVRKNGAWSVASESQGATKEYVDTEVAKKANLVHTHETSDVSGLATVATSGSYNDLSDKPTIPQNCVSSTAITTIVASTEEPAEGTPTTTMTIVYEA